MSFSPQSTHSSTTINRSHNYDRNDWSSQSSVGSSSSGSLSRTALPSITTKNDIHSHQFKDIVDHCERGFSECISCVESEMNLNKSLNNSWKSDEITSEEEYYSLVNQRDGLRKQLSQIRQFRDEYETQLRLREALNKMMRLSKSRDCDSEWKENSRVLIGIEKQLELMIGNFCIKVEEIEGWARICPRDQYEIEFRHGRERRVVRVRIGRDGQREWEQQEFQFRASLLDSIILRVREVKAGWTKRYVTLGVTQIETKDLLRARPQLMTLMANTSGSLKLKVRTKWTPALMSGLSQCFGTNSSNNLNNLTQNSNSMPLIIDESSDGMDSRPISRQSSRDSLLESLSQLMTALEDFQGQYEELAPMNSAANRLWKLLTKEGSGMRSELIPSDSEDIDAALAEFGFLDDNNDDQNNSVISRNSSPTPISSQWEACVLTHTRDAIIQLSHCGQWVLKAREKDAVNRLKDNGFALQELAINYGNNYEDFLGNDPRVKEFWNILTSGVKRDVIVLNWTTSADSLSILMHNNESIEDIIQDSSHWLTSKISECDYVTVLHVRAFCARFEASVSVTDILKVALDVSRVIRAKDLSAFETLLSRFIAREWSPHEVTWAAVRAIITSDPQMVSIAEQWLKIMCDDNESEILTHLLSGLESNSITTRRASCHALAHIRAKQTIDELLYVATEDSEARVRDEARKALLSFGGEAQQRWHQCSLIQKGFMGLSLSTNGLDNNNWAKVPNNNNF